MTELASGRAEWARYWYVALAAALGYSASGLNVFGIGPFIAPLHREFDWSRTQIMSGATIVSVVVGLAGVPMGWLIDRWGSRPIGLLGVLAVGSTVGLLGTATGTTANWLALWTLAAFCAPMVQANIWTSAVVTRFDAARGMALGVTLCGTALATFALPLLATWLIENFGWRHAFLGMGALWVSAVFPVLFLFFRGARDVPRGRQIAQAVDPAPLAGLSLAHALRSATFYKLTLASALFVTAIYGATVHMVPILTDGGVPPLSAAGAASLVGIFSLVGRLSTGAILDRFPARIVGAVTFLIPIPGCALLVSHGFGIAGDMAATAMIGFTLGAETDSITYLVTRHFGLRHFGLIQGALLSAMSVGGALGPLAAAATFDHFGSYAPFLEASSAAMLLSAILIASIGKPPERPAIAAITFSVG